MRGVHNFSAETSRPVREDAGRIATSLHVVDNPRSTRAAGSGRGDEMRAWGKQMHGQPTSKGARPMKNGRPKGTSAHDAMEAKPGFEPGVKALQASALPLGHFADMQRAEKRNRPSSKQWSGQRGSNPRPQPWQGCALPTEPCPHMVGDTRFELVTPSVSGKCSPPELIARLRCAPQRGINYSRAEFQMQQLFSKFFKPLGLPRCGTGIERARRRADRSFDYFQMGPCAGAIDCV